MSTETQVPQVDLPPELGHAEQITNPRVSIFIRDPQDTDTYWVQNGDEPPVPVKVEMLRDKPGTTLEFFEPMVSSRAAPNLVKYLDYDFEVEMNDEGKAWTERPLWYSFATLEVLNNVAIWRRELPHGSRGFSFYPSHQPENLFDENDYRRMIKRRIAPCTQNATPDAQQKPRTAGYNAHDSVLHAIGFTIMPDELVDIIVEAAELDDQNDIDSSGDNYLNWVDLLSNRVQKFALSKKAVWNRGFEGDLQGMLLGGPYPVPSSIQKVLRQRYGNARGIKKAAIDELILRTIAQITENIEALEVRASQELAQAA